MKLCYTNWCSIPIIPLHLQILRVYKFHKITSLCYNTRNNSLSSNGNGSENKTEISPECNSDNRPTTLDTCKLIINLEKTMLTRFDCLNKEVMNTKDVTIKTYTLTTND